MKPVKKKKKGGGGGEEKKKRKKKKKEREREKGRSHTRTPVSLHCPLALLWINSTLSKIISLWISLPPLPPWLAPTCFPLSIDTLPPTFNEPYTDTSAVKLRDRLERMDR